MAEAATPWCYYCYHSAPLDPWIPTDQRDAPPETLRAPQGVSSARRLRVLHSLDEDSLRRCGRRLHTSRRHLVFRTSRECLIGQVPSAGAESVPELGKLPDSAGSDTLYFPSARVPHCTGVGSSSRQPARDAAR